MNILILSYLYPGPHDASYGIFVHQHAHSLQDQGHQVTVIAPVPWAPGILHSRAKWRVYGQAPRYLVWDGVEVYYPRYLRPPGAWFRAFAGYTAYRSALPLVAKLHQQRPFDVIDCHAIFPSSMAGIFLGGKLNLPVTCTLHGNDIIKEPHENFINLRYAKQVLQRSSQVIAVSGALQSLAHELAALSNPVKVVYLGVDLQKFKEKTTISADIDVLRPYILYVGRDIRRKGLIDLLSAYSHVMADIPHNLVVIGPNMADVLALNRQLVETIGKRLLVTGNIPIEAVAGYMSFCDLFVLPSYQEGLPCVVLEAMACAKPVISTPIMGIPEAVVEGETGLLVQPGHPNDLQDAIQTLLSNPDLCKSLGQRGKQRVTEKFTWHQHAQQMTLIFENLVPI